MASRENGTVPLAEVPHRPGIEIEFGRVALRERDRAAGTFERQEPEIDAVAEEEPC